MTSSHRKIYELLLPFLENSAPLGTNKNELSMSDSSTIVLDQHVSEYGSRYRLVVQRLCLGKSGNADTISCAQIKYFVSMQVSICGFYDKDLNNISYKRCISRVKEIFGEESIILQFSQAIQGNVSTDDFYVGKVFPGFDFSILIDSNELPNGKSATYYAENLSKIRSIVLCAPLRYSFKRLLTLVSKGEEDRRDGEGDSFDSLQTSTKSIMHEELGIMDMFCIPIIKNSEQLKQVSGNNSMDNKFKYCMATCYSDRVSIIFRVDFQDHTDRALAKLFLKQLAQEARNDRQIKNAPICDYKRGCEPPTEFKVHYNVSECDAYKDVTFADDISGYLSFTFLTRHIQTEKQMSQAEEQILHFLIYLDSEVKQSKSFIHRKLHQEMDILLNLLN